MRPPGEVLAPGESLIATGHYFRVVPFRVANLTQIHLSRPLRVHF